MTIVVELHFVWSDFFGVKSLLPVISKIWSKGVRLTIVDKSRKYDLACLNYFVEYEMRVSIVMSHKGSLGLRFSWSRHAPLHQHTFFICYFISVVRLFHRWRDIGISMAVKRNYVCFQREYANVLYTSVFIGTINDDRCINWGFDYDRWRKPLAIPFSSPSIGGWSVWYLLCLFWVTSQD